jgi:hypothetical protein
MIRILFLDDCPLRTRRFKSSFPAASCAATSAAMIRLLEVGPSDVVCLDHDLGGETHVDSSREDTGMAVVRWIEQYRPVVGRFVIHSMNYPASVRMSAALEAAGYDVQNIPFHAINFEGDEP